MTDIDEVEGVSAGALRERARVALGRRMTVAERERQRARERHQHQIATTAQRWAERHIEELPDRLEAAADAGRFEMEVSHEEVGFDGARVEALLKGANIVGEWLATFEIETEVLDSGGEEIPDYGYTRSIKLVARWAEEG